MLVSMSPIPSFIIKANNYLVLTLIYLTFASYCFFLYWVFLVMEWKLLVPSYLIQSKPLVNSSSLFGSLLNSAWLSLAQLVKKQNCINQGNKSSYE